ncbi:hypothetical protein A4W79_07135 [Latilactobacillus curvatus]|nr:hypothetical protein A4W79_07135 [Latilactobacillus curvatus]
MKMKLENFKDILVANTSSSEIINRIIEDLNGDNKIIVNFINAHCFNMYYKDSKYAEAINKSTYNLNDGIGMELGGKILGIHFKENLNGTDFMPRFLNSLEKSPNKRVFLLGGKESSVLNAKKELKSQFPELNIVGIHNGYFRDSGQIIKQINKAHVDCLIVGMGVPLQEKWVFENKEFLNVKAIFSVGAYLDFTAMTIKRAPRIIRRLRLEWLFRLCLEPKRMWKRYIIGNLQFFFNVLIKSKDFWGNSIK